MAEQNNQHNSSLKLGDKVKHNNVLIEGKIVQVDKATGEDRTIIHVQCVGGTYYDSVDNWEPVKKDK